MSSKLSNLPTTPSPDPDDLMYIVRPVEGPTGSKQITNNNLFSTITRNITDKAVRFDPPATTPPLSAAGQAALYYAQAQNRLLFSENGGAYRAVGDVSGPNGGTLGNQLVRFLDGTGKVIKGSPVQLDDNGMTFVPSGFQLISSPQTLRFAFNADGGFSKIQMTTPDESNPGRAVYIASGFQSQTNSPHNTLYVQSGINQTNSASSNSLLISRIENSLGSGEQNFIKCLLSADAVGAGTPRFRVTNEGKVLSGDPTKATGRYTVASSQSANTQSFEAADTPQSTLVYKWPASDPLPGQVLIASPPVAGVVTLNWGFPAGMGRALFSITTEAGNVGTNQTLLQSFNIPPNTLKSDGDYFRVTIGGVLANNNNPKALQITQAEGLTSHAIIANQSNTMMGGNLDGFGGTGGFRVSGELVRKTNESYVMNYLISMGFLKFDVAGVNNGGGSIMAIRSETVTTTGSFTFDANSIQFQIYGTGVVDNDIRFNLAAVEVYNF